MAENPIQQKVYQTLGGVYWCRLFHIIRSPSTFLSTLLRNLICTLIYIPKDNNGYGPHLHTLESTINLEFGTLEPLELKHLSQKTQMTSCLHCSLHLSRNMCEIYIVLIVYYFWSIPLPAVMHTIIIVLSLKVCTNCFIPNTLSYSIKQRKSQKMKDLYV